ncbi:hypothetical protein BCD67_15120 [Oscillatoriales cyanobacterium USR001]|nr:hypothetical protein BCD67_15120 [Oscillatoriales cyanobacterium USR001]
MDNNLPSVLLIFDVDVLMDSNVQTWQQYAKAGSCYVPEVVFEEMEFVADEGDGERERLAKEFLRFFPGSGWQMTDALETHPQLEPAVGGNQSKQTRMIVATAQCVYGFTCEHPESLVVFVCNNQILLKRMQVLGVENLCGITAAMLSQWAKRGEQPMAVTQQLQNLMRSQASKPSKKPSQTTRLQRGKTALGKTGMSGGKQSTSSGSHLSSGKATNKTTVSKKTVSSGSNAASRSKTSVSKRRDDDIQYEGMDYRPRISLPAKKPGILSHLINGLGALFFLTLAVGIAWRGVQPESFDQFWRQKVVPVLPPQVRQFVK